MTSNKEGALALFFVPQSEEREGQMFNFGNGMDAVRSLMQFTTAYQTMAVSAGEVFFRRSLMMASGSMSPPDAVNMVAEKATTFAEAVGEATAAVVKGDEPVAVASAALGPYGTRTEANVRELQATETGNNPNGCWDFWGYSGPEWRTRDGVQMRTIKAIIDTLVEY